MNEFVLAILLTYQTKSGLQYRTDTLFGYKTEAECNQGAEHLKAMYLRTGKTNVKAFEYVCYERRTNVYNLRL